MTVRTAFFFLVVLAWLTTVGLHVAVQLGWYSPEVVQSVFLGYFGVMIVFCLLIVINPIWERQLFASESNSDSLELFTFFRQRPLWVWVIACGTILYAIYLGFMREAPQGGVLDITDGNYVIANHGVVVQVITKAQYDHYVHTERVVLTAVVVALSTVVAAALYPPSRLKPSTPMLSPLSVCKVKKILFYTAVGGWSASLLVHLPALFGHNLAEDVPVIWLLGIVLGIATFSSFYFFQEPSPPRANNIRFEVILNQLQRAPKIVQAITIGGIAYWIICFGLHLGSQRGSLEMRQGQYFLTDHRQFNQRITETEYRQLQANQTALLSALILAGFGVNVALFYPARKNADGAPHPRSTDWP